MLLLLLALGVQNVRGEIQRAQYDTFPGKEFPMNEASTLKSAPAKSTVHCSSLCLQTAHCGAANYDKDAGVCHMTSGYSTMACTEDSNHMIAIRTKPDGRLPWVGLWPLQEGYGGDDISGNGHHLRLSCASYPDDDVTPWASPAAYFPGNCYGYTLPGPCVTLDSYSWMVKFYVDVVDPFFLFTIVEENNYMYAYFDEPTWLADHRCYDLSPRHPAPWSPNTWHTVAVTFHFPTNTLTAWMDGTKAVDILGQCGSRGKPQRIYIGHQNFVGRASCLGLFSDVMDYDVMYAATMQHCGG